MINAEDLKAAIARELADDGAAPYTTLCRIASLLELPWPSADRRAGAELEERINAARWRFAVVELIAELLDETVPVGEMYRFVDSVRETLGERARGIEEFVPPAVAATTAAARALAERLLQPYQPTIDAQKGT